MLKDQDIEFLVDNHFVDKHTHLDNLSAANVSTLLEIKDLIKNLSFDTTVGDVNVDINLDELIALISGGIVTYSNDNTYLGSLKGSEGYALDSAEVDKIVSVMFGTNSYSCIAKERILKYEKVVSIGGTDAEPHIISAFKGVRSNELDGMLNHSINNVSTHFSNIVAVTNFSIVTLHVSNTLDQDVSIQMKGNITNQRDGAIDMGTPFTVSSSNYAARTVTIEGDGWMPYLYFEATCSTAPTSGNITGKFVMRT